MSSPTKRPLSPTWFRAVLPSSVQPWVGGLAAHLYGNGACGAVLRRWTPATWRQVGMRKGGERSFSAMHWATTHRKGREYGLQEDGNGTGKLKMPQQGGRPEGNAQMLAVWQVRETGECQNERRQAGYNSFLWWIPAEMWLNRDSQLNVRNYQMHRDNSPRKRLRSIRQWCSTLMLSTRKHYC